MDIKSIQKELKTAKLTGEIFTLGNLFIGEDILPDENIILSLTGFSGSYAILFVTPSKSFLFVDGRYELQAKKEINTLSVSRDSRRMIRDRQTFRDLFLKLAQKKLRCHTCQDSL